MAIDVFLRGSGRVLPPEVVTTEELARRLIARTPVDLPDEVRAQYLGRAAHVAAATGIHARRFFPAERPLDDILVELAEAIVPAGFDWSTLDGVVFASTSVAGFPGASQRLIARLRASRPGLGDPFAFDLHSNACTNFVYGLGTAAALIEARGLRNVLCLAVELASRCISWDIRDLDTSALFGDAAAGLLLSREEGFARLHPPRLGSRVEPATLDLLVGGAGHPARIDDDPKIDPVWRIPGPEVARRATALIVEELRAAAARGEAFDWLLPHQANDGKILAPACAAAGVARERLLVSLHEHGNTSSASLPLTLDAARREGRLRPGERLLLLAFGASFTVGSALVEMLPEGRPAPRPRPPARDDDDDIVVVGMAARFPEAADLERYWRNLRDGRDCTRDVPDDRWDIDAWYDPNPRAQNRTYCRRGGFIPDVHDFDPKFFRIAPSEAHALDPQQRQFLEVAYEALERAGSLGPALARRRTGVYVGVSGQENTQRTAEIGAEIGPSFVSGNTFSIVANRLSYLLDLRGPSLALDTACSSALVALHLARQALLCGEIDCAVIGAVSVTLAPWKYVSFARAGMLAPDGRCKTFSAAADGYVPGEGAAAAVLRRRRDAVRDGDEILGVIRASAVNEDGRTNGLTAPSPRAQRELYESVYRAAGVDPSTIDYIEAHGTGTSLGDPIEVGALSDAFAAFTARKQFCGIGSVKTNIGHLEPAAGMASLIKLLLALRHELIPPTLHLDVPSPHIRFQDTPFFPVVRPLPWPRRAAAPRRAAMSAMSFGGVNAHVLLEEPPLPAAPPAPPRAVEVVPLSARTPRALAAVAARLRAALTAADPPRLADVAFTLATGREHFERRAALVVGSLADLVAALAAPLPADAPRARGCVLTPRGPADGAAAALAALLRREPAADDPAAPIDVAALDDAAALPRLHAALTRLWTAWLAHPEAAAPVVEPDSPDMSPETVSDAPDGRVRIALDVAGAGEAALAGALAHAHRRGLEIDWLAVHAARRGARVGLPTYPLDRQRLERPRPDARAPNPPRAAAAAPVVAPLWLPRWTPRPAPAAGEPGRCWLIFEDALGVGAALSRALAAAGARVLRVRPGPGFDAPAPDEFRVHPGSYGDHAGLLAALAREDLAPDVLHLWGLGPRGDVLGDPDLLEAALTRSTASVLALLHGLAQPRRRPPRRLLLATSDALPAGGPLQVEKAGLAGLLRSAALELPELRIQHVDVAGDAPLAAAIAQIHDELRAAPPAALDAIAWRSGARLGLDWQPAPPTADAAPVLREGGVYWIVGGLGGLGRRLARHLAAAHRARLVLSGRTAVPERARWAAHLEQARPDDPVAAILRDLLAVEAAGGEVLTLRCDAAEPWQVREALAAIEARFGALHGVVHAAGVLRDGLLKGKTLDHLRDVLRPKLTAARTLADALAARPLDFLALFASIAGTHGNLGQADYAAANSLLDALAHHLSAAGRRVVALDWSLWAGDGMGAGLEAMARARGLAPLDPARALAAFDAALRLRAPQVLIAEFVDPSAAPPAPADRSEEAAAAHHEPVPSDRSVATAAPRPAPVPPDMPAGPRASPPVPEARPEAPPAAPAPSVMTLRTGPAGQPAPGPADLLAFAEAWLTAVVGGALDLPPEDITPDAKFLELGVDSILSVNILEEIEARLARKLSPSLLFDFFSIARLARHLADQHAAPLAALAGAGQAAGVVAPVEPPAPRDERPAAPAAPSRPAVDPPATSATPPAPAGPSLLAFAEAWLTRVVGGALDLPPEDVGLDTKFLELGVDSILSVNILEEIESHLRTKLSPSLLFDFFTVARLARHLHDQHGAALARVAAAAPSATPSVDLAPPAPTPRPPSTPLDPPSPSAFVAPPPAAPTPPVEPTPRAAPTSIDPPSPALDGIAVIGVACRFPGADDPASFWHNLVHGVDSVREPPPGRLDAARWYSPDPGARNRTYLKRGGWLDPIDRFDAAFFRISPREADWMAPAQRLFLEVAWEALEHAGHAGPRATRAVTGVFAGVIPNDSPSALVDALDVEITPTGATGNSMSIVANRVSYLFDLRGPSFALDTACSSGLVAVHLACQSLRAGECELAIAGGVNVDLAPQRLVAFAKAGFFSPDGRCKPFDDRGDGYVFGEGVGAVVLKPLARALADGDPILAVIRGSAIGQDGLTNGLTAPSSLAQETVVRAAWAAAGLDPATAGYVEAHGTGTALGDPIELRALTAVFSGPDRAHARCGLGSVKSNLGHLEGAAGTSALIKTCLMLRHRTLVPSLHFEIPGRHVDLARTPFYVVDRARAWPEGQVPRRAGVSSFGFGGTNVHVVLEEPPPAAPPRTPDEPQLLVLSAHSDSALDALAARWAAACRDPAAPPLADLCFTAATGRAERPHRLAVRAADLAELADRLSSGTGVVRGRVEARQRPRVVFLCPGQGAQQPRMAERLYRGEPAFRAAIDACAELLRPHLDVPLLDLLWPRGEPVRALAQTAYTQPAVFAVSWALARMWTAWGLTPAALLGHSLGEYVAACLAGVMDLEHAAPLVAHRARLMQALPAGGVMFAALTDEATARAAVRGFPGAEIAAINGPRSVTLAGDEPAVTAAIAAAGLRAVRLPVSHAFHSARMEPMLAAFRAHLRTVPLRPPTLPVISDLTGAPAGAAMADPEYWVRQIREPVRFADGLRWLGERGHTTFLEVGPGQALSALARDVLADRDVVAVPSLARDGDDVAAVQSALAALWVRGLPIDWEAQRGDRRRAHAPTSVFERQRHAILADVADAPAATAPPASVAPTAAPPDDLLGGLQSGALSVDDALARILRGQP